MFEGTNIKRENNYIVFDNGIYKFKFNAGWVYPRFSVYEWTRPIALALNKLFNDITLE